MLTTFLNTLRTQLRRPSMLVWVFAFPVILCTIFLFMFSGFSTDGVPDPVPVVVVTDSNWRGSSFSQVVDALSGRSADEALLDVTEAASADEARGVVEAGQAVGYLAVDAAGTPSLALAQDAAGGLASSAFEADRSILDAVTSSYVRNEALVKAIAQKDPSALSDPAALARALGLSSGIERVRLTHGTPDETVRYYYALLGMAALMAAQSAAIAVTQLQPGEGGLGARLCASGTGRMRMLLGALLGSWAVSMLGLGLAAVPAGACHLVATGHGHRRRHRRCSPARRGKVPRRHGDRALLPGLALRGPLWRGGHAALRLPGPGLAALGLGEPRAPHHRPVLRPLLLRLPRAVCPARRRVRGGLGRPDGRRGGTDRKEQP